MFKRMPSSFVYALAICGSFPSGASAGPALRAAYHRAASADSSQVVNDRPIIGILTQPLGTERNTTDEGAYIAASYVKFVEMSGARAVPVFHFDSKENLTKTFQSVNGLLFPGGGSNISAGSDLHSAGQILLDLALDANDRGDEFPIWGTCMGFQFLSILAAGSEDVLCEGCFTTEGVPLALNFTAAADTSYLLSDLHTHRPDLYAAAAAEKITANSHHDGILQTTFESTPKLNDFFDILSINTDPVNGRVFVSTIEAKKYPIMATQWHPEKNNFEWLAAPGTVPHTSHAVQLSEYVGDRFVSLSRSNNHKFPSPADEEAALIYKYSPIPDPAGYFEQIYSWDTDDYSVITR